MALQFDIVIDQGSDYEVTFPVLDEAGDPQALDGWAVRSQVRELASDAEVLHDFVDELSIDGSDVQLVVPADVSAAWAWVSAVYDIELVAPNDEVTRLVEGRVIVRPEVTR